MPHSIHLVFFSKFGMQWQSLTGSSNLFFSKIPTSKWHRVEIFIDAILDFWDCFMIGRCGSCWEYPCRKLVYDCGGEWLFSCLKSFYSSVNFLLMSGVANNEWFPVKLFYSSLNIRKSCAFSWLQDVLSLLGRHLA